MKKDFKILNYIKLTILVVFVIIGAGYVSASFSEPTCPPTGCNTNPPITIGSNNDTKSGRLVVGTADMSLLSQYVFTAQNGLSYIRGLVTGGLTLIDGTERDGYILKAVDNSGLATWSAVPSTLEKTPIYIDDFNFYVKRNSGGVKTLIIPSVYQYCAISQLGPDFANSDREPSLCSVNQNGDKTWTLAGQRADDPGFWCNVRCFAVSKPIVVEPIVNPTTPNTQEYYCLTKDVYVSGNSQWNGLHFGCSSVKSFDAEFAPLTSFYSKEENSSSGTKAQYSVQLANFYKTTRENEFADQTCGNGQWSLVANGSKTLIDDKAPDTGFKCN